MAKEDMIWGRNPVIEALKSENRTIERLYIADGDTKGSINKIIAIAREKKIRIENVDRRKLDDMTGGEVHQGVAAEISPYSYKEIDDIFRTAEEKGEAPFIIILDNIEDSHNFGAIIRTAECAGVHGIIIARRRSVSVTPFTVKASAGATEFVNIVKVSNITSTIEKLKEKGVWVYGADMDGDYYYNTNLTGPIALVIGSEGKGISRLVKENCDAIVKIPMNGKINSLNASVASGILVYDIVRQRLKS